MSHPLPLLKITNLKVDRGERTVISNLNLTLNRGEKLMIRGDNGCGKTTLLKTVARLLPFKEGQIEFTGKTMGWVPQEGVLSRFPIASREVVMIGTAAKRMTRKARISLVREMMEITGSSHLADRCFHHLSGGEKQRISLARCLCQRADLLLLDEPASYLDRDSRDNLEGLFQKIQNETGAALMLVTHEQTLFDSEKWIVRNMDGGVLC